MATRPDEAFERFARLYYEHVAPEDLVGRSDRDLGGPALSHWSLARVRRPGEIKVHVYSPNLTRFRWSSPGTTPRSTS